MLQPSVKTLESTSMKKFWENTRDLTEYGFNIMLLEIRLKLESGGSSNLI
jgi:hypothetical protein